jgi:hypothetical protein
MKYLIDSKDSFFNRVVKKVKKETGQKTKITYIGNDEAIIVTEGRGYVLVKDNGTSATFRFSSHCKVVVYDLLEANDIGEYIAHYMR